MKLNWSIIALFVYTLYYLLFVIILRLVYCWTNKQHLLMFLLTAVFGCFILFWPLFLPPKYAYWLPLVFLFSIQGFLLHLYGVNYCFRHYLIHYAVARALNINLTIATLISLLSLHFERSEKGEFDKIPSSEKWVLSMVFFLFAFAQFASQFSFLFFLLTFSSEKYISVGWVGLVFGFLYVIAYFFSFNKKWTNRFEFFWGEGSFYILGVANYGNILGLCLFIALSGYLLPSPGI